VADFAPGPPLPARARVESKVLAATAASWLVGVTLAVLADIQNDQALLGPLPDWLRTVLLALTPPLLTLLAGYHAPHTARPAPAVLPVPDPDPGEPPDD
jgi:hypothetical protein